MKKREKSEAKALLLQWCIFVFGFVCLFLDVPSWIAFACMVLPWLAWVKCDIKNTMDNIIDSLVSKIDKKVKKRLRKLKVA